GVVEVVVLDLDREALHARVGRRPLRDRPRAQRAVDLEAEVVVQRRRVVLLDDEARRCAPAGGHGEGLPDPAPSRYAARLRIFSRYIAASACLSSASTPSPSAGQPA